MAGLLIVVQKYLKSSSCADFKPLEGRNYYTWSISFVVDGVCTFNNIHIWFLKCFLLKKAL